jgi:hypothetical protein
MMTTGWLIKMTSMIFLHNLIVPTIVVGDTMRERLNYSVLKHNRHELYTLYINMFLYRHQ